ncbi:MAG: hypothetical protein ACTHMG_15380 [Sphingomonas sp.]
MRRTGAALWLGHPTRWAKLDRGQARVVLALVAVLLLACLFSLHATAPAQGEAEIVLYGSVVDALRHGAAYYAATAAALRDGGYPLSSFLSFRLPTLAVIEAALPPMVIDALLLLLGVGTVVAWYLRLQPEMRRGAPLIIALLVVIVAAMPFAQPDLALLHEVWAGLLVSLALALYRRDRWVETVAITLIAMLIRETALLFALVMAVLALTENARREVIGWAAAIAVFGVVVVFHAAAANAAAATADPGAADWSTLLGFGFFVRSVALVSPLAVLPLALAAILVGLALVGWASWAGPTGARGTATILLYAALVSIAARADTFYWAAIIGPLLPIGLLFAPDGIMSLANRALDKRRITVTRVKR